MKGDGDQTGAFAAPPVISAMLAPVRAQIVDDGLDHQSTLNFLKSDLGAETLPATGDVGISDPTVALADAWAVVSDVLGFYQERLVNESYIGTAVEDLSVFELARMVGYKPDGGLAASCYLYYTIDESVSQDVRIPAYSKIRAMPQPGEQALTFETRKDLVARSRWNAIRLATTQDCSVDPATSTLYLRGTATGLKSGDLLKVTQELRGAALESDNGEQGKRDIYFSVQKIEIDREMDQTKVSVVLRYGPMGPDPVQRESLEPVVPKGAGKMLPVDAQGTDVYYQIQMKGQTWVEDNALAALTATAAFDPDREPVKIVGFRRRAGVFGHGAPRRLTDPRDPKSGDEPWSIDDFDRNFPNIIDLEGHQASIVPSSRLAIEIPDRSVHGEDIEVYTVAAVQLTSRTAYGMTGDVTRLTLDRPWKSAPPDKKGLPREYEEVVQRVIVHIDDSDLHLGRQPIATIGAGATTDRQPGNGPLDVPSPASEGPDVTVGEQLGDTIELNGIYLGINPGRMMILDGKPPIKMPQAQDQEPELLTVESVSHPPFPYATHPSGASRDGKATRTILRFREKLKYTYDPKSVKIYGNVVEATHGETYSETLGSGNGAREHQSFALARSPLTLLPVPTFPGANPELIVTVGAEKWTCIDTLACSSNGERVFSLWIDETASARVYFGNGRAGARLPTGRENIKATYRIGVGRSGNVSHDRLKLPVDHPLGVKEVSNTRASGGSDREPISLVRSNTPLSTVALDRLVSKADFLHMARVYPGIAKARVRYLSIRDHEVVTVSILSNGVVAPEPDSVPCTALQSAMSTHQDGVTSIFVVPGILRPIKVAARVKMRAGGSWDDTEAMVRAALVEVFGFSRRELGQSVHASEALAAIQSVNTVDFASLTEFRPYDVATASDKKSEVRIEASDQGFDQGGNVSGAELLLIQPHIPGSIALELDES
ncbi:MAG: hypothetical protein J0H42_29690 [Rhizobiales bacterium]|nr:hypothetical protein [Hyphomicrobiales bacterium]